MVQETAVAEPTQVNPEGLTAEPVEEATPAVEASAALTDEAAATEEAPAPSVYGSIHDPYQLIEHETVKPVVEARIERLVSERRKDLESEYTSKTADWESTNLSRTIHGIAGPLAEQIRAENIPGAERLVSQLERLSEKYDPVTQEALMSKGWSEGHVAGGKATLGLIQQSVMGMLDERGKDEVLGVMDKASSWNDVFTFLKDRWSQPHKDEIGKLKQEIERLKLNGRSGEKPNLAEGAGSGASNDYQKRLDRLSYGRDSDGHEATNEDRAWLAARE